MSSSVERRERGPAADGDLTYAVRTVSGSQATKRYRCPGCDHEIEPGTPHVVVWPLDHGGPEERRHWHRGCWTGRATRSVTRRWS
nr:ATP/GTP-binding protein [Rhodococcus rhodnii]